MELYYIKISDDGKIVADATKLWNVETGELITQLEFEVGPFKNKISILSIKDPKKSNTLNLFGLEKVIV
jgi:hypothetical protein